MGVKPGYKQTEVGVIPEEWDVRQIDELCKYQNGTSLEHLFTKDEGFKVISIGNYSVTGSYLDNGVFISRKDRRLVERFVLRRNDLAMLLNDKTAIGTIIGRVLLIEQDDQFVFNQRTMRLTPKANVSPAYLQFAINADRAHNAIVSRAKPGTQIYVNTDDVVGLKLPVPSPLEQRAIAQALSDMDGLLDALDRLIAKKRDLKQATMQQLLTGETRLPGFHGEWERKTLLDIAGRSKELFDDGDWIEAEFLTESGIRLVQTGNIGEGRFTDKESTKYISSESFKKLRCKELQIGDILICRLADPPGRACILPDIREPRMITAVDVTIFRPPFDVADRRYLVNVFSTPGWFEAVNARCGGSTRTRIARGQLGKIEIKLPSLPEQTAIACVLSDMDTELEALERRREKTRALKQAMMQELLTGRTRLISPEAFHA